MLCVLYRQGYTVRAWLDSAEDREDIEMTDEELLSCDDERSMDILLSRYRDALVRFCDKFVHNDERAEEIAQDTMLKVFLYRGRFDPTKSFKAWLWPMARNLCYNEYRRKTIHPEESRQVHLFDIFHDSKPSPESIVEHEDMLALMHRSIAKLPELQRATIALVLRGDMTYKQIGEKFGITKKGVRFRMSSARKKLREMMGVE